MPYRITQLTKVKKISDKHLQKETEFTFPGNDDWATSIENIKFIDCLKNREDYCMYLKHEDIRMEENMLLGDKRWLISTSYAFCIVYIEKFRPKYCLINRKKHITKKGIYFQSQGGVQFFDFRNNKIADLYIKRDFDTLSFYDDYIYDSKHQTFYTIFSYPIEKYTGREKDVLVHFNDTSQTYTSTFLKKFKSSFINQQMNESDEIYLDLKSQDFSLESKHILIYLNSRRNFLRI